MTADINIYLTFGHNCKIVLVNSAEIRKLIKLIRHTLF